METTLDQPLDFILDVSSQMSPAGTTNEVLGLEHIAGQTARPRGLCAGSRVGV